MIRTVSATRYVTPLRQGGSLPALVEADDESLYVLKFTGAGQGPKALIAELVAGEIGRALGLRVPELVFIVLDPGFGADEPDSEIRGLLAASTGPEPGAALPAPLVRVQPAVEAAARRSRGVRHRLVRRLCDQRGSLAAQYQHAVAPETALADRPWGVPLLPPRLAGLSRTQSHTFYTDPHPCAAAFRPRPG